MMCVKCSGLMVPERTYQDGICIDLIYCINCGERFDDIIALNRSAPPITKKGEHINGRSEVYPKFAFVTQSCN